MTVDVANTTRLNLGSFNRCVDYLERGQSADYGIPDLLFDSTKSPADTRVLYYPTHQGLIVRISDEHTGSSIGVPLFDVGCAVDKGKIDDPEVVERLMAHLELEVMAMIHQIVKENGAKYSTPIDHIKIPVRSIQFFDDDNSTGCYGWVEIGVALIV